MATRFGTGDDELLGDRTAERGRHRVVAADLVDVMSERRPVEQLAVEMAGDESERGAHRTDDDEDPRR